MPEGAPEVPATDSSSVSVGTAISESRAAMDEAAVQAIRDRKKVEFLNKLGPLGKLFIPKKVK